METVREVCTYIGSVVGSAPVCIETGCTYSMPPGNEIHTTTNNIYEYIVCPNGGHLFSLDIDSEHVDISRSILYKIDMDVHSFDFMLGDSVESMIQLSSILKKVNKEVNVLWLDSSGCPNHTLSEFMAVQSLLSSEGHFVLVDDIHNPNSIKYKKVVPLLKQLNYKYKEIQTPTGLFLSSMGYDL